MKNTLGDLNNHLFAQLERLGDEDLTAEELDSETRRAKSITSVANTIIKNSSLSLKAIQFKESEFAGEIKLPAMLEGGNNGDRS